MRTDRRIHPSLLRAVVLHTAIVGVVAVAPVRLAAQDAAAAALPDAHGGALPAAESMPGQDVARATAPAARAIGAFTIRNARAGFPQAIVLADSAGRLVAHYRAAGSDRAHPMHVAHEATQLELRADTPHGPLVVRFDALEPARPGAASVPLRGRWQHRGAEGVLRGTVRP